MTNSYNNKEKPNFFRRMWNKLFHKVQLLDAPLEYTQREIKLKYENILNYLKYRSRI